MVGERRPSTELDDPASWTLTLSGLVEKKTILDLDRYLALEHRQLVFDIHCVTSWTRYDGVWRGVPLAQVLRPAEGARYVSFSSYSARDHHTSLPIAYALEHSWLVHEFEGEPLSVMHGGPVRVVTPGKYFYKSIKWVKSVEALADDRLGWWETDSNYHNNADSWRGDERFTTGSLRPHQLRRFMTASTYDKYRGRVMLGLDLRGWLPATRDLRRLYLKNCDISGVDLTGADLRNSNLSLSSLQGAALRDADLSGSDLEGADFTDADLRGANLSETALSATRFEGAAVTGANFESASGLVESQEAYLAANGHPVP